jgi:hypothetical protein
MRGIRILTGAALAIGLGALGAAPAFAAEGDGGAKPKKAKDDTSRRVCKSVVPTGSRMSGRICRTKAEWDAAMDKSQENVLRHQTTEQTLLQQAPGPM